jgi:hypothetical protein
MLDMRRETITDSWAAVVNVNHILHCHGPESGVGCIWPSNGSVEHYGACHGYNSGYDSFCPSIRVMGSDAAVLRNLMVL